MIPYGCVFVSDIIIFKVDVFFLNIVNDICIFLNFRCVEASCWNWWTLGDLWMLPSGTSYYIRIAWLQKNQTIAENWWRESASQMSLMWNERISSSRRIVNISCEGACGLFLCPRSFYINFQTFFSEKNDFCSFSILRK